MPRRATALIVLAALPVLLGGGASGQDAQPNVPVAKPKPQAAAPDPALEAARAAFEALPDAERKAIQGALVWTGDYNAVTAGTFGPRTFQGIAAWQKRSGAPADGILTKPQRTALDAAGAKARDAARFRVRTDAASGATIGVPDKLLPKASPQPGGTRWQSADARVTLETKSFKPGETDLDALFERATAPGPDRKITYKVKKPDFIVVTGETAGGRSYIRYAVGSEGIRGFTIGYDKALAAEIDRLVIAIANSFEPFPPPSATANRAPVQAAPPVAALAKPAAPAGTGLVVAPGRVLTASSVLDACSAPVIAGQPANVAKRDPSSALALLAFEAPAASSRFVAPTLRAAASAEGEDLVVLAAESGTGISVAPGSTIAGGVSAPLQPGAAGAPILDRSGRLVGLVATFSASPRRVAGIVPPTRYAILPGAGLAEFLSEAGIPASSAEGALRTSLGSAAAPYIPAVVAITCGR